MFGVAHSKSELGDVGRKVAEPFDYEIAFYKVVDRVKGCKNC